MEKKFNSIDDLINFIDTSSVQEVTRFLEKHDFHFIEKDMRGFDFLNLKYNDVIFNEEIKIHCTTKEIVFQADNFYKKMLNCSKLEIRNVSSEPIDVQTNNRLEEAS